MRHMDITLDGLSVMIGMPAGRDLPPRTVTSLIGTFSRCQKLGIHCELGMVTGSAVIQWARDEVVDLFLASQCNRLFWIDSDMIWTPEDFIRLLALSKLEKVIGAAYPAKMEPPTFLINVDRADMVINDFGLMSVKGLGLGFTVMDRSVVEELAAGADRVVDQVSGKEMASVFRIDTHNRNRRGEDMAFFADIRELGHKVFLDPSINLGHVGGKVYTGSVAEAMRLA